MMSAAVARLWIDREMYCGLLVVTIWVDWGRNPHVIGRVPEDEWDPAFVEVATRAFEVGAQSVGLYRPPVRFEKLKPKVTNDRR